MLIKPRFQKYKMSYYVYVYKKVLFYFTEAYDTKNHRKNLFVANTTSPHVAVHYGVPCLFGMTYISNK